jgi:hypothetical protein
MVLDAVFTRKWISPDKLGDHAGWSARPSHMSCQISCGTPAVGQVRRTADQRNGSPKRGRDGRLRGCPSRPNPEHKPRQRHPSPGRDTDTRPQQGPTGRAPTWPRARALPHPLPTSVGTRGSGARYLGRPPR